MLSHELGSSSLVGFLLSRLTTGAICAVERVCRLMSRFSVADPVVADNYITRVDSTAFGYISEPHDSRIVGKDGVDCDPFLCPQILKELPLSLVVLCPPREFKLHRKMHLILAFLQLFKAPSLLSKALAQFFIHAVELGRHQAHSILDIRQLESHPLQLPLQFVCRLAPSLCCKLCHLLGINRSLAHLLHRFQHFIQLGVRLDLHVKLLRLNSTSNSIAAKLQILLQHGNLSYFWPNLRRGSSENSFASSCREYL
mmetsp:Transcript_37197/g.93439  ORF Transcript_37197/g.93439 Transcript_37197/m.93439 type:complete len:255 (+) Transcript_37197:336-1100(+)